MAKLVFSATEPEIILVDTIKSGQARLLVRWDVEQVETEDGEKRWEYMEQVVSPWILPSPEHIERVGGRQVLTDAGRQYIDSVADELLDYAKAAGI